MTRSSCDSPARCALARSACVSCAATTDICPPPVVAAVCTLTDALLRLDQTPDEELEQTVVTRLR